MSRRSGGVTFVAIAAIAAVAGVVAQLAPAAPTGDPTIDAVLAGFGVALIVLIGAMAPWWAVATAAGAALAVAIDPVLIVLALAALGAALWVGSTGRARPEVLALVPRRRVQRARPRRARRAVRADGGRHRRRGRVALRHRSPSALEARAHRDLDRGRVPDRLRRRRDRRLRSRRRRRPPRSRGWPHERRARRRGARERRLRGGRALVPRVGGAPRAGPRAVDRTGRGCGAGSSRSSPSTAMRSWSSARPVLAARPRSPMRSPTSISSRCAPWTGASTSRPSPASTDPLTRVREALVDVQQQLDSVRTPWLVHRAEIELDDFDASIDEHLPSIDNSLDRDPSGARHARRRRPAPVPRAVHDAVGVPRPRRLRRQLRRADGG